MHCLLARRMIFGSAPKTQISIRFVACSHFSSSAVHKFHTHSFCRVYSLALYVYAIQSTSCVFYSSIMCVCLVAFLYFQLVSPSQNRPLVSNFRVMTQLAPLIPNHVAAYPMCVKGCLVSDFPIEETGGKRG